MSEKKNGLNFNCIYGLSLYQIIVNNDASLLKAEYITSFFS